MAKLMTKNESLVFQIVFKLVGCIYLLFCSIRVFTFSDHYDFIKEYMLEILNTFILSYSEFDNRFEIIKFWILKKNPEN
jgi:hypothetical protein